MRSQLQISSTRDPRSTWIIEESTDQSVWLLLARVVYTWCVFITRVSRGSTFFSSATKFNLHASTHGYYLRSQSMTHAPTWPCDWHISRCEHVRFVAKPSTNGILPDTLLIDINSYIIFRSSLIPFRLNFNFFLILNVTGTLVPTLSWDRFPFFCSNFNSFECFLSYPE